MTCTFGTTKRGKFVRFLPVMSNTCFLNIASFASKKTVSRKTVRKLIYQVILLLSRMSINEILICSSKKANSLHDKIRHENYVSHLLAIVLLPYFREAYFVVPHHSCC